MEQDFKFPEKYLPPKKQITKETDATLSAFKRKFIRDRGGLCDTYKSGGTFRKSKEKVLQSGGYFNITLQQKKSAHTKSNATSGHSDDVIHLVSKGQLIVWYCENKLPGDLQSLVQKEFDESIGEFAKKVSSKVLYSIVTSREDFVSQYEKLINN